MFRWDNWLSRGSKFILHEVNTAEKKIKPGSDIKAKEQRWYGDGNFSVKVSEVFNFPSFSCKSTAACFKCLLWVSAVRRNIPVCIQWRVAQALFFQIRQAIGLLQSCSVLPKDGSCSWSFLHPFPSTPQRPGPLLSSSDCCFTPACLFSLYPCTRAPSPISHSLLFLSPWKKRYINAPSESPHLKIFPRS